MVYRMRQFFGIGVNVVGNDVRPQMIVTVVGTEENVTSSQVTFTTSSCLANTQNPPWASVCATGQVDLSSSYLLHGSVLS